MALTVTKNLALTVTKTDERGDEFNAESCFHCPRLYPSAPSTSGSKVLSGTFW
jgi:hypothetical protein